MNVPPAPQDSELTVPSPTIPPAERPRGSLDPKLEQLEEDTLDKQAKSATYRDALERRQHLETLNRRIDVLQSKLDSREADLQRVLPRLAQLEQAERVSQVLIKDGTVIFVIGGALLSLASLFVEGILRTALAGLGVGLLICGVWIAKILNINVWPPSHK